MQLLITFKLFITFEQFLFMDINDLLIGKSSFSGFRIFARKLRNKLPQLSNQTHETWHLSSVVILIYIHLPLTSYIKQKATKFVLLFWLFVLRPTTKLCSLFKARRHVIGWINHCIQQLASAPSYLCGHPTPDI